MLKKFLSGGLAVLASWQRLHVSARIGTGQYQRLGSERVRDARAQAQVTLPVMITGSAAASGVPIEVVGGVSKRP
jgi:hypothetical protein